MHCIASHGIALRCIAWNCINIRIEILFCHGPPLTRLRRLSNPDSISHADSCSFALQHCIESLHCRVGLNYWTAALRCVVFGLRIQYQPLSHWRPTFHLHCMHLQRLLYVPGETLAFAKRLLPAQQGGPKFPLEMNNCCSLSPAKPSLLQRL